MDSTQTKPSLDRMFGPIAAIICTITIIIHVLSIIGIDVQHYFPPVMLLHMLIFVCFVPFVLSLNKRFGGRAKLGQLRQIMPKWTMILGGVLFAYAMINFFVSMDAMGGTADFRDGQYILHNRGELVRVLTEAEYHRSKASMLRMFSGHWIIFSGLPALYFLFAESQKPETP